MTEWTPDNWCACPRCNGPSFPVADFALPASVQCAACGHRWSPTPQQYRTASAMERHRDGADLDGGVDRGWWWEWQVSDWRKRTDNERAKLARALEGRW